MGGSIARRLIARIPVLNRIKSRLKNASIRKSGERRLKELGKRPPIRIVIGASGICDEGWIETDIEYLNLLNPKHWETYFQKDSIDAILAEHVWEHLTPEQGLAAARKCFEYLRPGGYLRVAVPDGFFPDPKYIEYVRPGGSGAGADDHKVLYDHITFSELFTKAGFRVEPLEYHDSKGVFHFVEWKTADGTIFRSKRFDDRNTDVKLGYTSVILDAYKPYANGATI